MKKHFASIPLVLCTFLIPSLLCILLLFPLLLSQADAMLFFFLIFFYVFYLSISFAIWHNAFCRFEMDESGIRNKYIEIKWEEIQSYKICPIEWMKYSLIPTIQLPSILCIGKVNDGGFITQNPHDCVFFALTKKNQKMFQQCAKGKSGIIDRYLDFYKSEQE